MVQKDLLVWWLVLSIREEIIRKLFHTLLTGSGLVRGVGEGEGVIEGVGVADGVVWTGVGGGTETGALTTATGAFTTEFLSDVYVLS